MLDSQYTDAGRSPAERFVAEEYILDLLNSWEGHRWVWYLGERAEGEAPGWGMSMRRVPELCEGTCCLRRFIEARPCHTWF